MNETEIPWGYDHIAEGFTHYAWANTMEDARIIAETISQLYGHKTASISQAENGGWNCWGK